MTISTNVLVAIFIVWLIGFFIPLIVIFYTPYGLKGKKIFNRGFAMKCVSVTLFAVVLISMVSGIFQLFGAQIQIFGQALVYWHALLGYILILAVLDHLTIHIKDIYRYLIKRRPKVEQKTDIDRQP